MAVAVSDTHALPDVRSDASATRWAPTLYFTEQSDCLHLFCTRKLIEVVFKSMKNIKITIILQSLSFRD